MNRFLAISIVAAAALLLFTTVDQSQACSNDQAAQVGDPSDGVLTVAEADEGDDDAMPGDDGEASAGSEDQPSTDQPAAGEGSGGGTDEGDSSGGSEGEGGGGGGGDGGD